MPHHHLCLLLFGVIVATTGCTSTSSTTPRISARAAGKIQTVEMGVVHAASACVIEGDTGRNYSISSRAGANAGQAIAYGVPVGRALGGMAGAIVGGVVGEAVENRVRERPGQMLEIVLDDGRHITVVQDARPPFIGGERVKIFIVGDEAHVVAEATSGV